MTEEQQAPRELEADPAIVAQHLSNKLSAANLQLSQAEAVVNQLVVESAQKDGVIAGLEQQVKDRDAEIEELRRAKKKG